MLTAEEWVGVGIAVLLLAVIAFLTWLFTRD